jgi:argininosuccinate lyase
MVKPEKEDWERFGRASKPMAPELMELSQWRNNPTTFDTASYYAQILIHRAHTVMLCEEKIIKSEEATAIIEGIKEVEKEATNNPRLVNYMSTETALIKKIGEVGGKMHIGRSRNDLAHTKRRLYYRDQLNRVIKAVIDYRKKLIKAAEENLETFMPGYTHWRQAQPITLGHYIMGHIEAASRSIERLEDVYKRTNLSPLGGAAFAGTGWPVNRIRTMELLGCDGLVENTHDGVASMDYYMEFAAAIAIHMSNLSRLSEDIQVWSSDEFKFIDLDEAYAGTSSIMPQKKNPIILEQVRSYASESIGAVTTIYASMKGMPYTNTSDRAMLEPLMIDTVVGSTNAMAGVVYTMKPLKENMISHLRNGFSTMTELADALVRLFDLSFRQAHDIIAHVTVEALNKGVLAEEITSEMISKSAETVIGKPLKIPIDELKQALDPELNVKRRNGIGMPAPDSVRAMINTQRPKVDEEEKRLKIRLNRLEQAKNKLIEAEKML